ncbi:MAG: NADH dehydrogenase [Planctomycetota bacterium]
MILGGGFAGVRCARNLSKALAPGEWEVVLFNTENHMVFHPMLAEVAGGALAADSVAAPLRQMLPRVACRTEDVSEVNLKTKHVHFTAHEGSVCSMAYDQLVIACGVSVNLGAVPGMVDHAFALKTVGDAVQIRAHVMQQLEKAEVCPDVETRREYLSFIVVGGGFSGVEVAGEINDLARGARRYFRNIGEDDVRVTLIHSRGQLLPEIGEKLREFTRDKMEKAGVTMRLKERVAQATSKGVVLKGGELVKGQTIVCTIGTTPSLMIQRLDVPKERGRLVTEADMRLKGRSDEWAIGDCAMITNAKTGEPSPPTGQFADRQGKQVTKNILRTIAGETTQPFAFKPLGQLCAIGGHSAVAEVLGMRLSGFVAWVLWRAIYLSKLPSLSRKAKAAFDWAWQVVFSRDLTHMKSTTTERVCRAWYQDGDAIFNEGDPASDFYVIERGEVEVIREPESEGGEAKILAVLGEGDFFGEVALMSDAPRNATVRARGTVEVVVLGREVFRRISSSLAPLEALLADAVAKRSSVGESADTSD